MQRLQSGDQAEARAIFERYQHRLVALAKLKLCRGLRSKVDPEDIVQSALLSFFMRQRRGDFNLDNWGKLFSLLMLITIRKSVNRTAHLQAARRGGANGAVGIDRDCGEFVSKEANPEDVVAFDETVEIMMTWLTSKEQTALRMMQDGYSMREISEGVQLSQRTLTRLKGTVERRLERFL